MRKKEEVGRLNGRRWEQGRPVAAAGPAALTGAKQQVRSHLVPCGLPRDGTQREAAHVPCSQPHM